MRPTKRWPRSSDSFKTQKKENDQQIPNPPATVARQNSIPEKSPDESDPKTLRPGPKSLARQYHAESPEQRLAPKLYQRTVRYRIDVQPDDFRPRDQE